MRAQPFCFQFLSLLIIKTQRRTIIDRRLSPCRQTLALPIKLFGCLVAGIQKAGFLKLRGGSFMLGSTIRLTLYNVRLYSHGCGD